MRAPVTPDNQPLFAYILMPTHMRSMLSVEELENIAVPFQFTKGVKTMKIKARGSSWNNAQQFGTLLYNLEEDPGQKIS